MIPPWLELAHATQPWSVRETKLSRLLFLFVPLHCALVPETELPRLHQVREKEISKGSLLPC